MDVSISICKAHNMTPFDLFRQDTEEVIMIINYYIHAKPQAAAKQSRKKGNAPVRVRVNDKTATGGWY